ncbi:MAG: PAS domain S-box protein [Bacillota bacterium]
MTAHHKNRQFPGNPAYQNKLEDKVNRLESSNKNLQENLLRFQAMVENNPAGIVVEDKDRNIILTNQAFFDIFSLPGQPKDLTVSNCSEAAEAVKHLLADPKEFLRRINEIISRREQVIGEEIIFADGRIYERDYIPVFAMEEGALIGQMWQYREINTKTKDEKNLAYQYKLLEALFKNATDAIIYFDQNHCIIDINDRFRELFGYQLSEIKGMDIDDLHDTGKKGSGNREYTKQIFAGNKVSTEGVRYNKCGEPINVIIKGVPVVIEGNFCGGYAIYTDTTEQKRATEKLQERERQLNNLLDNLPGMVYQCRNDRSWTMEFVSSGCLQLTGYSSEELLKNKTLSYNDLIHPDHRESIWQEWQARLAEGKTIEIEYPIIVKSGEIKWVWERGRGVYNWKGEVDFLEGLITDINERKKSEQALKESEKKYRDILSSINDGYFEANLNGNITFCNEAAAHSLGYSINELIGMNYRHFFKHYQKVFDTFNKAFKSGKAGPPQSFRLIRKDGSEAFGEFSFSLMKNSEGYITGFRGIGRDVTDRESYEKQLKYLSLHDQLTGLYNRVYFENEFERLDESREYPITIISVDLDGLKLINDTMGHNRGDQLLIVCAKILKQALRKSDILTRIGGDEFVAILPRTTAEAGEEIAGRIQEHLEKYNQEKQEQLPLSISLGYATADRPEKPLQQTFKEADDLMYRAKLHKGVDARAQIIHSLMATLGERDFITEGHARRLENLCIKLGKKVGLSKKQLSDLRLLAQIHDLGKVGVPDNILFKKISMTQEEWSIMKQHSEKGYRIALSSSDLSGIADLILKHHENWDGSGYPLGLKGEEIPIECRILAVTDAYDAMTNDRPYRQAMPPEEAMNELRASANHQFDPALVDEFISILEEVKTKNQD